MQRREPFGPGRPSPDEPAAYASIYWSTRNGKLQYFSLRVTHVTTKAVKPRVRLAICTTLGALAGLHTYEVSTHTAQPRDLAQVWYAARALLRGIDPYAVIGPGRNFEWSAPMFYPLPAAVALVPLAPMPQELANAVFVFFAAACFAWALMEHGYVPLINFASAAMVSAVELAQWSPLLAASIVVPPLAVFYVAKPTIGLALFVARPSRWAVIGALVLGGIAFIAQPHWLSSWRAALIGASFERAIGFPYVAPVLMPGGALALLTLARWRRPEARLIAALACVPQTMLLYETLPLFLVPRSLRECEVMLFLSFLTMWLGLRAAVQHDFATTIDLSGQHITLLIYLPLVVMLLRRPNQGPVPEWLERRIENWPKWVRGSATESAS